MNFTQDTSLRTTTVHDVTVAASTESQDHIERLEGQVVTQVKLTL